MIVYQDGDYLYPGQYIQTICWIADCDDTAFGAGTLTWQDPVHSWKAGPGEVMTVENLFMKTGVILLIDKVAAVIVVK
jgi:hypothetical protein